MHVLQRLVDPVFLREGLVVKELQEMLETSKGLDTRWPAHALSEQSTEEPESFRGRDAGEAAVRGGELDSTGTNLARFDPNLADSEVRYFERPAFVLMRHLKQMQDALCVRSFLSASPAWQSRS